MNTPASRPRAGLLRRAWARRWNALRLLVAASLLAIMLMDTGARLARRGLEALPGFDYQSAISQLVERQRNGEALTLIAGAREALAGNHGASPDAERKLDQLEASIKAEQASFTRRAGDLLRGIVLGVSTTGEADDLGSGPEVSIERLIGAVGSDFFVIGDIRDLIIQAGRAMTGRSTDPVIAALSGVGLLTTLAPEIDWAPSLLKAARRTGAMTRGLSNAVMDAAKSRRVRDISAVVDDAATLARSASPGGAMRLLRLAESPADLARLARFVERSGPGGASALLITGRNGADALKAADAARAAGKLDEAVAIEKLVVNASRKGEAGGAWLKSGAYRALVKPHVVVGLLKTTWNGTLPELLQRAIIAMSRAAWWLLPLVAAWTFLELGLLVLPRGPRGEPKTTTPRDEHVPGR
jgi:hypothetical protein